MQIELNSSTRVSGRFGLCGFSYLHVRVSLIRVKNEVKFIFHPNSKKFHQIILFL